jgi:alpha-ribazole phosphatase
MTLIDMIRHGETETPGRLLGRSDPEMSEAGWGQFERQTAERAWDAIVTSPRRRTHMPATRLASARGLKLRVDDDWAELDFGAWDGLLLAELHADSTVADAIAAFYRCADTAGPPGGESWSGLQTRVARALDRLVASTDGATVLVVTHAGPMRAALAMACAIPFANLWTFRIEPGTRITLHAGRDAKAGLWGEVVEVVQP